MDNINPSATTNYLTPPLRSGGAAPSPFTRNWFFFRRGSRQPRSMLRVVESAAAVLNDKMRLTEVPSQSRTVTLPSAANTHPSSSGLTLREKRKIGRRNFGRFLLFDSFVFFLSSLCTVKSHRYACVSRCIVIELEEARSFCALTDIALRVEDAQFAPMKLQYFVFTYAMRFTWKSIQSTLHRFPRRAAIRCNRIIH